MKQLLNGPVTNLKGPDGKDLTSFAAVLRFVVDGYSAQKGTTIGDMRKRLKVGKKLDEAVDKDTITLEDQEHTDLLEWWRAFVWPMNHETILLIDDALAAAKAEVVRPAAAAPPPPTQEEPSP